MQRPEKELPSKMIFEPIPQLERQSIEDFLRYYEQAAMANVWDDHTAAKYLPQFITDNRYREVIYALSEEKRASYREMKQALLLASVNQPKPTCCRVNKIKTNVESEMDKFFTDMGQLIEQTCHQVRHYMNRETFTETIPNRINEEMSNLETSFNKMIDKLKNKKKTRPTSPTEINLRPADTVTVYSELQKEMDTFDKQ